ncbi:MAG: hypothetical protein JWQ47_54 [Glaciihabitans sp.]|nr:hypothetical protein [Glaciihabitans sp.]
MNTTTGVRMLRGIGSRGLEAPGEIEQRRIYRRVRVTSGIFRVVFAW